MSQISSINDAGSMNNEKQLFLISAKEFSAKYKSKRECFDFLTVKAKAYLSAHETVTIYWLKDLINSKKQCKYSARPLTPCPDIKCDKVKIFFVPQYEGLSIETILGLRVWHPEVNAYLPDDRDIHKLPRQWLANVFYTIIGEPFQIWVDKMVDNRNTKVAKAGNMMIEMDAEVYEAFKNSTQISSKSPHPLSQMETS